ncbi:DEAD/DEAH box helicase family protein [Clostridium butyricum]|uniref:DEAD/DEAH box helicase family protein n=1 Tax=Clostridium butyricum TaxID=1492 RepID=UPI0002CA1EEA|nr:DEAD/DEAH box helicase family protein [Clostridium butyricum]EMU55040.1 hypothetical protein CBDKU1_10480 [Clostridium butyricum DKU-01]QGH22191.1 DEAD/DEAH box helicase [Clostridium butyricum]QGH26230.1 DEAD/DEAH box helicase [Clostridium butyricum]
MTNYNKKWGLRTQQEQEGFVNSLPIQFYLKSYANIEIKVGDSGLYECPLCKKKHREQVLKNKNGLKKSFPYMMYVNDEKNQVQCANINCELNNLTGTYDLLKELEGSYEHNNIMNIVNTYGKYNIEPIEYGYSDYTKTLPKPLKSDYLIRFDDKISEKNEELTQIVKNNKKVIIQAPTGSGKTYSVDKMVDNLETDFAFLFVPNRSLAEQVRKLYPNWGLFYGSSYVPDYEHYNKFVCTYDKASLVQSFIDNYRLGVYGNLFDIDDLFNGKSQQLIGKTISYTTIVDETHELLHKRRLVTRNGNNKARTVEDFVKGAKYQIYLSASTDGYMRAWNSERDNQRIKKNDDKLFHVKAEPKQANYSADSLTIYRLPKEQEDNTKYSQIIAIMEEAKKTHKKVLYLENDKKGNTKKAETLSEHGFTAKAFNSDNKDDDDIITDYTSIIDNGRLINDFTLTTTIIDAGVSIYDENVCTIVRMDKNRFDPEVMIQFMGRIRSTKNNDCILILDDGEYFPSKNDYKKERKFLQDYAIDKANELNLVYFNSYDSNTNLLKIPMAEKVRKANSLFEERKDNDGIKFISDCIYLNNNLFEVDFKMVEERCRMSIHRSLYYNDKYIVETACEGVKARIKHNPIIYKEDVEIIEVKEEEEDDKTFAEKLSIILNFSSLQNEFESYLKHEIYDKQIQNGEIKDICDNNKEDISSLRKYFNMYNNYSLLQEKYSVQEYQNSVYEIFLTHKDVKERDQALEVFKRLIYSTEYDNMYIVDDVEMENKVLATQDYMYYSCRKVADKVAKNNHSISDKNLDEMVKMYAKKMGWKIVEDKDKKGNKHFFYFVKNKRKGKCNTINNKLKKQFNELIQNLYEVSASGRLNKLKQL